MIAKKDRRYVVSVRHQKELINRMVDDVVEEASTEKEELLTDPEEVFAKIDQKGEEDEDDFVPSEVQPLTEYKGAEYKGETDNIFKRIDRSIWNVSYSARMIEASITDVHDRLEEKYNTLIDIAIGGAMYKVNKKLRIVLSFYFRDDDGKILDIIVKSLKLKEKLPFNSMKLERSVGYMLEDTVDYLIGSQLTADGISIIDIINARDFGQLMYGSSCKIKHRAFYPSQVDSYGFVDDLSLSIGSILCDLTEGIG